MMDQTIMVSKTDRGGVAFSLAKGIMSRFDHPATRDRAW